MFYGIRRALMFLVLLPVVACAAEQQSAYKEGVHYQRIAEPVPTQVGDKVEVAEVFWYGCGHCYHFEPLIQTWKKGLPNGTEFVATPAIWNQRMAVHAQIYYTAEALGVLDMMHGHIFKALNVERKQLVQKAEIRALFVNHGVDGEQFDKIFGSFKVNSDVRRADARARSYGITGTPEMIVNGRYRVSARMAGSQENMLKVVDYLVAKELRTL